MKLNPQQAPLYGDCVVTVLLAEEDRVEEDVVFYLVFSGSALHHCASTRKVSSDTLETIAPGHDCCETVKVLLCASRGGLPVSVVAEEDFRFIKDEVYDAAQFLATSAGNQQALNFTRFLDRSGPPAGDVNSLDEKVALAFRHLKLPAEWNVLGTDAALHDAGPRETLMHFAVRRGLLRLTWFLLQKPGGRGALSIHNQEGATPVSLALERGHHKLHQLLTQEDAGEPDSWSSLSYEIPYGECSVRHHRGLGVYTLTSGAEARQEPPAAEESCTGQIFKLMNIQQQLMKSNLGQMDNLLPLMVTAQDPCSAPSTPETDGCFLPGAPQPWGSQQLPLSQPQQAAHCQGGPAGQSDRAPLSMAAGENPDQPCRREAGVATKGEEAEPACAWDSRAVPGQDSCLTCEPRCAVEGTVEGTEGSPCSGDSQGEHGREPGALKSGSMVMEPGPAWCPPGGVLAAGVAAGAAQQELEAVAAPTQEQAPQGREKDAAEGFGTSDAGAVGAAALGGGRPAASAPAVSHGGSSVEKAAEAEAPGRRPLQNADVPVGPGCLVPAGALDDRIPGGLEPGIAPTAGLGEAAPCLDVGAPRAQQSEESSCTGGGLQGAACARAQGTVPPGGQSGAQHPRDGGPPSMPGASAAAGSADPQAGPVPSRPAGETPEPEDDYPLGVLDEVGQRKELKRDTLSVNTLAVVSPPHDVPETAEAAVPGQAVTSDSTVSLAGGPGSESGTRDDALCPVPSHGEEGAAAPRLHAASDGRERQDGEPGEPGEKGPSASGTAADLEPGMGNTSPAGLGGEPEGPAPSAHPEAVDAEGGPEAAPQSLGPAAWAAASAAAAEGKSSVAPESPVAPGQADREEAATRLSTEEGTLPSGALRAEQRTPAPGLEPWAHSENSSPAAHGEDRALQPCHSPHTTSAWLETENARDPEGAPRGSLLSEDGAAGGLAAEQKRSPPSPRVRQEGSEALSCELPLVRGVGAKTAPSQESVDPHGVRRDEPVGAAAAGAPQGPSGPGSKEFSHDSLDVPLPEVVLGMENSVTQGLPEPVLRGVLMDVPGAASPEMPPADCREGWLEGADHSCAGCGATKTTMGGKAQRPVLQARPPEDEAPAGGLQCRTALPTGGHRSACPLPPGLSAHKQPLLQGAHSIEAAASHIVEAVMEWVRTSGALMPQGAHAHPESGSAEEGGARPPEVTLEESEERSLPVRGPAAAAEMPDTKAEDEVDFLGNGSVISVSEDVALGSGAPAAEMGRGPKSQGMQVHVGKPSPVAFTTALSLSSAEKSVHLINQGSWCALEPCPDAAALLASQQGGECEDFLDVGLGSVWASGSDSELVPSRRNSVHSILVSQPAGKQSASDVLGPSASAEDTTSRDQRSPGGDVSAPSTAELNRPREELGAAGLNHLGLGAEGCARDKEPGGHGEVEEEEELDSITDVPAGRSLLRGSVRPLSPFRRHSWGPGKNTTSDAEMNQRSSMRALGEVVRRPPIHRRSMSWCPSGAQHSTGLSADCNYRSFSLEGLAGGVVAGSQPSLSLEGSPAHGELRQPLGQEQWGGSLLSLSEEELGAQQQEHGMFDQQMCHRSRQQGFNYCTSAIASPLTKSVSLMTISHSGLDIQQHVRPARRVSFSIGISALLRSKRLFPPDSSDSSEDEELHSSHAFPHPSARVTESIIEESYPPKKDVEWKSGTKVSRTFSYIKNKMSSSGKKSKEKEKEKEKIKEKEKDSKEKEKDKKPINGHSFSPIPVVGPVSCSQCAKPFINKEAFTCASCGAFVHKGCRESLASCAKVKMKQPRGSLQAHDTSSLPTVIMRAKPSQPKERPRSAVLAEEATAAPALTSRRCQQGVALSKSVSIQNITGVGNDETMSNTWKFLSHSTDSLNKICKVNESTESLTDEGTDMNEGQLMGDFEIDSRQLEAESWSRVVDSKFLKQQKKDAIKRQEVIYELMQTEFHHIRTLKIMGDVYGRGMVTELLFEQPMVEKLFPCLDELISIHSQFFQKILERKKECAVDKSDNFLIQRIGDVLVGQFSGENAERLKKIYGKFCGQHNQSVNYFKDLYTKDKRFQAFVKKKMSSPIVRRLGIPECILLVTQRITKYPVLFQRILQCTKDNEVEREDLAQCLSLVKDVIGAVDSKVASYERKARLHEIYTRTDSKSIMRMKSGQMFAKEDLKRKQLVRDGSVFLKSSAGRLKEVQAVLLTDILVFLQEKDQKYVFASLDQKSTVISLKKLIVREVAHEEKGLFLISMGVRDPEMVEVHAGSKEERNSWMQTIQDTISTLNRDEDEGIPSENEEEKKMLDTKARELKEQLQQKDQQILLLLEEKEVIFRELTECSTPLAEDCSSAHSPRALFRASTQEALRGGPLMKSAISEVELLQGLVSASLGGMMGQVASSPAEQEGAVGPVSLPRRAETFGGFDSHQMNAAKGGEKDEGDEGQDLRRTESDSGLKKGGNANLVFTLKRNSEQVAQSIVHLHQLLSRLQGVVLQQDSYIEDQKLVLSERLVSRGLARPSSLIEQEKQRSLEKQRQGLADLQKQQAQHVEERRRREREWEARERELQEREARLAEREEQVQQGQRELEREQEELRQKKGAYQGDLERLRAAQRQLEREQERLRQDTERLGQGPLERDPCQVSRPHGKLMRIPSFLPSPEEPPLPPAPPLVKSGSLDSELSVSPKRNSMSRTQKDKGPFHMLTSASQTHRGPEGPGLPPGRPSSSSSSSASSTASSRLFGLAKPKEKKEKKKKSRGGRIQPEGPVPEASAEGEEIFC